VEIVKHSRKISLSAVALAGTLAAVPAWARESSSKEAGSDFGIGVVAVLANVVYMPVKMTYGLLGGVTGGFAYVLSGADREVADGVWIPSLGGDYVLTTEMMKGRERVHFNGVRDAPGGEESDRPAADEDISGSTF